MGIYIFRFYYAFLWKESSVTNWRLIYFEKDKYIALKVYEGSLNVERDIPSLINHPPHSPDINPVEYIFGFMKDVLQQKLP